jgi:hypothetical protein
MTKRAASWCLRFANKWHLWLASDIRRIRTGALWKRIWFASGTLVWRFWTLRLSTQEVERILRRWIGFSYRILKRWIGFSYGILRRWIRLLNGILSRWITFWDEPRECRRVEGLSSVQCCVLEFGLQNSLVEKRIKPRFDEGEHEDLIDRRPASGVRGQHRINEIPKILAVLRRNGRKFALDDISEEIVHISALKSASQCTELIKYTTKRPNICFGIVMLAFADFGGKITGRPDLRFAHLGSVIKDTCNSKITELYSSVLHKENILKLQIAMQNFPVVKIFQSKGNLNKIVHNGVL